MFPASFGREVVVKARPAKTVIKALLAVKRQIQGNGG